MLQTALFANGNAMTRWIR